MRSLRHRLRKVVLAVPMAACVGGPAATVSTSSASSATQTTTGGGTPTSSIGGTIAGFNLCDTCMAKGLICNPWDTGCVSPDTTAAVTGTGGSSPTGGSSGEAGTSGTGTTGVGSLGGTTGTGSSTTEEMCSDSATLGGCNPFCDCVTEVAEIAPIAGAPVTDAGALRQCDCLPVCAPLHDAGAGSISRLTGCTVFSADAGAADGGELWDLTCYVYTVCGGVGRRPDGLADPASPSGVGAGAYFARTAHLEAASIVAFRRLERELRALGAPEHLSRGARRAAREEIRHTRLTRRLAHRFGATTEPLHVMPFAPRSLEALAIENAREGCVGETLGAALVSWQALHAHDSEVRAVAQQVSEDELGHAELAWEIAAWADSQLDDEARRRVQSEREAAIRAIESNPAGTGSLDLGLPSQDELKQLVAGLRAQVWVA